MTPEEIAAELAKLTAKADEVSSSTEHTAAEAKALIEEITPRIAVLEEAAAKVAEAEQKALNEAEAKALKTKIGTLESAIEDLRKPAGAFVLPTNEEGKGLSSDDPYADGSHSIFQDIRLAARGSSEAKERLTSGFEGLNAEGKAMTEGTNSQGGYLVRPQIERQLVLARESDNVLRSLCSKLNVTTNAVQLDQLGLTTTAGWVAELATKPESTGMTLATVNAAVHTAAGLATISNQLLADSNPAIDGLVTADLAKRLVALEEAAFISGSGTGQPYGILNTPGIGATALTATDIPSLLDAVLDAIAAVETAHGAPSAILMHPRTWTAILKSRDAQGAFYIDPTGGPQDPRTGLRGPVKNLWGYTVVTSNRIPTNLGGGTNESRIVVGDFREALILDRQGITVDESEHVYFTTNQTVFRAEQRVGFTAGRTPLAFNVIGGAGMANK
jgi:HK97 family phage major capsid protein